MKVKLIIVGAAGRMGRRLIALSAQSDDFQNVAAIERPQHPEIGKDAGLLAGTEPLNIKLTADWPDDADVAIDFSLPAATDITIENCLRRGLALVLGTTGLTDRQRQEIKSASENIPVIYGTNMSVGMNLLFSLVGKVAAMLGDDYDIEIVEQHHNQKKDAPSGSALTLAENICRATGKSFPDSITCSRSGKDASRLKGTIGVHAVRAGDITGVHSVMFSTLGETLNLTHTAHSRDTFARGALRAAKWLIGKKPALYSIADVLGIS